MYLITVAGIYFKTTVSIVPSVDSKYAGKKIPYPNDLVHFATNSRITYSHLTTQNLYILHPYRRKSIRKDMSDLR